MEHNAEGRRPAGTLIIAEAGVNHNGDTEIALKLCDAAKDAGADVVKFQTWKTEALLLPDAPLAEYQKRTAGGYDSQFAMAKALELPFSSFRKILEYCNKIGIRFLSTPDDEESLNFLTDELGLDTLKIGSGEVTNILFLTQIARKNRDVILSTGMSTIEEVDTAFNTLMTNGARSVALLHCTSNYPAPFDEVNLRVIGELKRRYNTIVGYSDHTEGIEGAIASVALGADILEKHLTLDRQMDGPDHQASIEPGDFKAMVSAIRNIEKALGSGNKRIEESESLTRKVVQRSLVAKMPISKGELLTEENVTAKRSGKGLPASEWLLVKGKPAIKDYIYNEFIDQ